MFVRLSHFTVTPAKENAIETIEGTLHAKTVWLIVLHWNLFSNLKALIPVECLFVSRSQPDIVVHGIEMGIYNSHNLIYSGHISNACLFTILCPRLWVPFNLSRVHL